MQAKRNDGDGWRIPAGQLETIVDTEFKRILGDKAQLAQWLQEVGYGNQIASGLANADQILIDYQRMDAIDKRPMLQLIMTRVDLTKDSITITCDHSSLVGRLIGAPMSKSTTQADRPDAAAHRITLPIAMKRRGVETKMVLTNGNTSHQKHDASLVQLIAKAHCYLASLTDGSGRNLTDVAKHYDTELSEVSRILPLAFLAPSITEAILTGRHPTSLTAQRLLRLSHLPLAWNEQLDRIA